MSIPVRPSSDNPGNRSCDHPERGYYRWPFKHGSGYHIIEWCPACHQNIRAPAVWVSRSEVIAEGLDPETLPVVPNKASTPQPTLFPCEEGGVLMASKREQETGSKKPQTDRIKFQLIPKELRERDQWVLWSYQRRKGKWTKVPYQPGGIKAEADDPSTWSPLKSVASSGRLCRGQYSGVGYVFAVDDPYTGIDLDDAIDPETKELKPWAKSIVDLLASYTEISPSGTGVKLWVKAKKPGDRCKTKHEDGEVEMYDRGRYFCMTGQHWPGAPTTIEERQAVIDTLYHHVFAKAEREKSQREGSRTPKPETRSLADDELIEKATKAKNGDKFSRLMAGDTSDYHGDDSAADQALCNLLAFWTNKDEAQMDRIFRSSGLMRDKWHEKRGEHTYGQRTIAEACNYVTDTYQGPRRRARAKDFTPGDNGHCNGDGRPVRKPMIVLGVDEYRVNNEAIEALSNHETAAEVYQRGNLLVRVLRAQKAGTKSRVDRPEGTPRIGTMSTSNVRELLTRVADFVRPQEKKKKGEQEAEVELIPAHPPDYCTPAVLSRGHYPKVRCIEGITETPTLRGDGTILDAPGWDAATGLLYEPNADFPEIPKSPTRIQATIAADRLLDLVGNFPFAGETADEKFSHRAAWLAGLLTTLVRFAIHGPCPLFLFDANCPGTGKSLLTDIIAIITTGRTISRTSYPDEEAEQRKRITSIALAGDRLMLFDNIAAGTLFGGAPLEAALTGTTWQDRILGRSEMTPELPLHTVFFGTGNNVTLASDTQRRVIPCRLETNVENPEERDGFKYPNLLEHVQAQRGGLVCDGLTIMRAFVAAGSPQAPLPAFGSYEAWSRLVRQAAFWVMRSDPCETRTKLRANDSTLNTLAAIIEGWMELPGGRTGITIAETLRILNDPNAKEQFPTLRGALMDWSRNDRLPGAGTIGHKLRSLRKRVSAGRMLDAESGRGGIQKWKVVQAT